MPERRSKPHWLTIGLWVCGTALGLVLSYNAVVDDHNTRITKLEAAQINSDKNEATYHTQTDRRFIELREELQQVNRQLQELIRLELQNGRH